MKTDKNMERKQKEAWITGASGMLGLALTEELLEQGWHVTTVIRKNSSKRSVFPSHPDLTILELDLDELAAYQPNDDQSCDAFFHFAWQGTIGWDRFNAPLQEENIRFTLDAIALAYRLNANVFLGAGSQAEYGRVDGILQTDTPTRPENGYGMAKLAAGQLASVECGRYGIRLVWMRILSVYGAFQGSASLVPHALHAFQKDKCCKFTKGEQLWDLLYVKDAARAFRMAAENVHASGVYVLGSGTERPLAEYILEMREIIGRGEAEIGALPYPEGQVMRLCADLTRLKRDTGFVPEWSFEDGIRDMLKTEGNRI